MLSITNDAADLIVALRDDAGLAETAGLRIACRDDHPSLYMRLADRPLTDDTVVSCGPVNVFLGPRALIRLGNQTLNGRSNAYGSAFYLSD